MRRAQLQAWQLSSDSPTLVSCCTLVGGPINIGGMGAGEVMFLRVGITDLPRVWAFSQTASWRLQDVFTGENIPGRTCS